MSFYSFKPTDNIEILGVNGTYPRNDNCYNIKLHTTDKEGKPVVVDTHYIPKPVVDLFIKMKETLSHEQINTLYPLIEAVWDEAYEQAGYDYSLSNADESL